MGAVGNWMSSKNRCGVRVKMAFPVPVAVPCGDLTVEPYVYVTSCGPFSCARASNWLTFEGSTVAVAVGGTAEGVPPWGVFAWVVPWPVVEALAQETSKNSPVSKQTRCFRRIDVMDCPPC